MSDLAPIASAPPVPAVSLPRSIVRGRASLTWIATVLLVGGLAAGARLVNLLAFQVHTDEATWILWTDAMDPRKVETLWTTFRADGRTPLYSWAVWLARQAPIEPLLAARLVPAISGVATTWVVLQLGIVLFGRVAGLAGAALYATSAYAVFFERIANDDGLATLLGALATLCAAVAVRREMLAFALLSGVLAFLSFLTKPTGALFLAVPVLATILLSQRRRDLLVLPLGLLAALGCYLLLAVVAGPMLELMDRNRNVHALPIQDLLKFPMDRWIANAQRLSSSWLGYHGWPIFLLAAGSLILPLGSLRARAFVMLMALMPLVFFTLLGGVLFSRYLLIGTPYLALAAGVGAVGLAQVLVRRWPSRLWLRWTSAGLVAMSASVGAPLLARVVTTPATAPLPSPDRDYIEGVASGWGVHEVAAFLRAESAYGRVTLLKRSGPFYPEIAVMHELRNVSNVRVRDERLLRFDDPSLAEVARWRQRDDTVYFFVNACCWEPSLAEAEDWRTRRVLAEIPGVQRVATFDRPGDRSRLVLFKL